MKQTCRIQIAVWLAFVLATGMSCRSPQSNQSRLIPQVAAAPAGPMLPLHSATLVYRILPATRHAEVITASLALPGNSAQPSELATQGAQLLVIRYPNPSGKRDSALAELMVTEPVSPTDQSARRWPDRWNSWVRGSLPGIAWSDGVREAKALTIPVRDLRSLLRHCQEMSDIQLASHESSSTEAMLLVDINGKPVLQPRRRSPELDALVGKIRQHGRLVSCLVGSGAELAEMASATDAHWLATLGTRHDQLLVRLPPAASRDEETLE